MVNIPEQPAIPGGYALLARKTIDSELMNKPSLYLKLFVWMLLKANFQDRDKLKRGMLVTSISEMQEAMSYFVGYRKHTPSKDEIRSAYEAFAKATMITTAKTTRGMIITICNYEFYQNPENYEAHSEAHNEKPTKPTITPHDTEECKEGKKENIDLTPESLRLSGLLADLILKNSPKNRHLSTAKRETSITKWAKDIGKLIRLDNQSEQDIEKVIVWCQKNDFWKSNILSGGKLRKHWDQLSVQIQGNGKSKQHQDDRYDMFKGA